ncbi:MAG: sortase B protein-sorting domain-containing protein, partial [Lachnospiraceae bacterium]|nr:sortase B protein-sorting domain-containing protein [Lachnospiraceae bacterium]
DVAVDLTNGASVATASTSTQSGSDAAQAGQQVEEAAETEEAAVDDAAKTVPHTADENPIVWLWILLGTSGAYLGYRSKKELEDRLREDIR